VKLCALYLRVSSDGQREKHTIDSQKRLVPKLAATHGYEIFKEPYVDDGISGESIEDRPAFRQLLDDASAGCFQAVAVIDFDRLTRPTDLIQLALIKRIFYDNNISVITSGQVFDPKNEDHDFLSDLFGILAKHEKRKILARIKRGIKEKRRQGKWIMGRLPIPYRRDPAGNISIDPRDQALVLAILDDARTMGRPAISEKYGLYQGKAARMLSRKRLLFYAGYLEVDDDQVKGLWPPIISLDDAEEILGQTRQRLNQRRFEKYRYLLCAMAIFFCACGRGVGSHTFSRMVRDRANMSGPPRLYARGYYRCNRRDCKHRKKVRSSGVIEALVLGRLEYQIKRAGIIRQYAADVAAASGHAKEISILEGRIADEESRKRNLIAAVANGVIEDADARDGLRVVNARLADLNASLARLVKQAAVVEGGDLAILEGVSFDSLDFEGRRAFIRGCIAQLVLHESALSIEYRFPVFKNGDRIEIVTL